MLSRKPPKIKRPLYELTHWLIPFQDADDAAHELRGRIINEYARAEYIVTGLCLRLKDRPEYQGIRQDFPFLMSRKISFLRQCLKARPLSKYEKIGNRILEEVEKASSGARMDHAHSVIDIDLMHSDETATRFSQKIIVQKTGDSNIAMIRRSTVSIDDLRQQLATARRHSTLLRRCQDFLIKRGIALRNIST